MERGSEDAPVAEMEGCALEWETSGAAMDDIGGCWDIVTV
jgi:hypothetical protein